MRRTLLLALVLGSLAFAPTALAAGGSYVFAGGTAAEQATVHAALQASSFDWNLLPQTITVHIGAYGDSYSTYGNVFLDAQLLDAGVFAWGVVQHEFGHQVDFLLLDDAKRAVLQQLLGGKDWCYETAGLQHPDHACERFASELAWAYWPSAANSMRPTMTNGESSAMAPAAFRALLAQLIGAPTTAAATTAKAYAPSLPSAKQKRR